ncbi:hypothetical protein AB0H49_23355 [Nocardia sp. NPDC050713]|uniref:hypothetical protein n=1 Tax=Nocardia sp. NPDC050713 TaxID=3154511 RepID=UPI0033EE3F07
MTTRIVEYLADIACAGSLLGLRSGASVADIDRAIGDPGYVDDIDKRRKHFRRDYGLIEFVFKRDPVANWACFSAKVAVHRLRWNTHIPRSILPEIGEAPPVVPLGCLTESIIGRGRSIRKMDTEFRDFEYYSISSSPAQVIATAEDIDDILVANSVWSIALW